MPPYARPNLKFILYLHTPTSASIPNLLSLLILIPIPITIPFTICITTPPHPQYQRSKERHEVMEQV